MKSNKPYVPLAPVVIEQARQIDILTYLRDCELSNLMKVKGTSNVYCTAECDKLKISNTFKSVRPIFVTLGTFDMDKLAVRSAVEGALLVKAL